MFCFFFFFFFIIHLGGRSALDNNRHQSRPAWHGGTYAVTPFISPPASAIVVVSRRLLFTSLYIFLLFFFFSYFYFFSNNGYFRTPPFTNNKNRGTPVFLLRASRTAERARERFRRCKKNNPSNYVFDTIKY